MQSQIIKRALEVAEYGTTDGGHHKMWVIDQMVRILTNCPTITKTATGANGKEYTYEALGESEEYKKWVDVFQEEDEDGEIIYEWDTGIAP